MTAIKYGSHLFPGLPVWYIRTGSTGMSQYDAHRDIAKTLMRALSEEVPGSIISQLDDATFRPSESGITISFMNYGDTELVYLVTLSQENRLAALVNQPQVPVGIVESEFLHLRRLSALDQTYVLDPIAFYRDIELGHELYVTRYVKDALCIAVYGAHGIFDYVPQYNFIDFTPSISQEVNSAMIALLVNYYDEGRQIGLAKTETAGNDFLLTRDFRMDDISTVLPNMRLIAARGQIEVPFYDYLDMLRREFTVARFRTDVEVTSGISRINTHSRLAMTRSEIEEGIDLGLSLRACRDC